MPEPCNVFYKVLGPNGEAVNGGHGQWPLPHDGQPGKWIKVTGPLRACQNGLHVCRLEQLVEWLGPTIWRIEIQGERIEQSDKIVARRGRLLSRCEGWTDTSARLFAVACARRALEREREAGREPDTRSWNALTVATDEQLIAARAASWAVVWAAEDAARAAEDAAGDAAWAAERQWQLTELKKVLADWNRAEKKRNGGLG